MTNAEMSRLSDMVALKVYRMLKAKAISEPEEDWLTTAQAAEYLRCSVSHLRRIVMDVPHEKLGGRYRFSRKSLSDYIARKA